MQGDTILVPLEDGDRTRALKEMGKTVIAIDLNPLSRTSKAADVTIVDDVVRALPQIINHIKTARDMKVTREKLIDATETFDNAKNLKEILKRMHGSIN